MSEGSQRPGPIFCFECAKLVQGNAASPPRFAVPESYTLKRLAERIINSRAGYRGRKFVTVLFADIKDSTKLCAYRDPEEARKLLDPVHKRMLEASSSGKTGR